MMDEIETQPLAAYIDEVDDPSVVAIAKDGRIVRQIDEDEIDAEVIFRYQAMAAKSFRQSKSGEREIVVNHFATATQYLILNLFTVDGQPITIDHLTGRPSQNPTSLGLSIVSRLATIATEQVSGTPQGKP